MDSKIMFLFRLFLILLLCSLTWSESDLGATFGAKIGFNQEEFYSQFWEKTLQLDRLNQEQNQNELVILESKAKRLESAQTMTVKPSITASYDDVNLGTHALNNELTWQTPTWGATGTLQSNDEKFSGGSWKLNYNLLTNLPVQMQNIQKQKMILQKKQILQNEQVLFNSLKKLAQQKMQIRDQEFEVKVREGLSLKANSYLEKLNQLVKVGLSAKNDVKSLELFIRDNDLQILALKTQKEVLYTNLAIDLELETNLLLAFSIDSLIQNLAMSDTIYDYSWRLDSLNVVSQRLSYEDQDLKDRKLSVGLMSSIPDFDWPKKYNYGVFAEYSQGFSTTSSLPVISIGPKRVYPKAHSRLTVSLEDFNAQVQKNIEKSDLFIQQVIERMRLGERGILQEITQNLNTQLSQQLNYASLLDKVLQSKLNTWRSLEQLPLAWRPKWRI
jgi:hypothetical protein